MTVGVALCRMSSTRRKSDQVSISLPSGECMARICFITALSSEDEKRWARSLLISCNFGGTATVVVVVGADVNAAAGAAPVEVKPPIAAVAGDVKPASGALAVEVKPAVAAVASDV